MGELEWAVIVTTVFGLPFTAVPTIAEFFSYNHRHHRQDRTARYSEALYFAGKRVTMERAEQLSRDITSSLSFRAWTRYQKMLPVTVAIAALASGFSIWLSFSSVMLWPLYMLAYGCFVAATIALVVELVVELRTRRAVNVKAMRRFRTRVQTGATPSYDQRLHVDIW